MSLRAVCWISLFACAAQPLAAQRAWQPSLHAVASLERGRGSAFEARDSTRRDDDALSLGVGLDGRHGGARGAVELAALALAHDPASRSERGLFAALRLRATRTLSPTWRLSLDESARLQRGRRLAFSDWQRIESRVALERRGATGRMLGLALGDRRRGVPGESALGFARQALDVSCGLPLGARHELQLQLGPQRFVAQAGVGTRLLAAAELVRVGRGGALALRAAWTEPLSESSAATQAPGAVPPGRAPGTFVAGNAALSPGAPATRSSPSAADAPRAGLLGEGLIVDPAEDELDDWDLGRRKQELLALGSWRLGARASLGVAARLVRERGPDRLAPAGAPRVVQERASLRVSLRHPVAARATLIAQAAWQGRRDARPGYAYSRLAVSAGFELRP